MIFHFFSPQSFEKWNFENPFSQGIGGSETAHIECAIRLAERGHEIYSYSPLEKHGQKEYKNVQWFDLSNADFSTPGIWVISRSVKTVKKFTKTKDQKIWIVMQDVDYADLEDKELTEKIDRFFPLCTTHENYIKNKYPYVADRVTLSSNGIRTAIIEQVEQTIKIGSRDPHRLMYASSPDRGLINLLHIFPHVKRRIKDASLHVFYGFDNMEKVIGKDSPIDTKGTTIQEMMDLMKQDGIYWHGRVGQMQLYQEYFKTGIWAYPTRFSETSCITSMEAQATGAFPVTNPFWALKDNVMYGSLIDGDPFTDNLTRMRYVEEIIYWMNQPKIVERFEMMKKARERFDWSKVIDQYETLASI